MLNLFSLLTPTQGDAQYALWFGLSLSMVILMAAAAITAIVLILMQPTNSSGIDALGGSSETFFGKNKGKSVEAKMKKWTWICLAILVVFAIVFYVLQLESIWA